MRFSSVFCSTNVVRQIHSFRVAASRGSVTAMTLLARPCGSFASHSLSNYPFCALPHLTIVVRWLLRARRHGSVDAMQELALVYVELRESLRAVHDLLWYLERTHSLFSLAEVGPGLGQWWLANSSFAWVRRAAELGAICPSPVLTKAGPLWADFVKTMRLTRQKRPSIRQSRAVTELRWTVTGGQ
jgi:hypothetical protein